MNPAETKYLTLLVPPEMLMLWLDCVVTFFII